MKLNLGKTWRLLSTRGEDDKMTVPKKASRRSIFAKKIFSRGKKNVPELIDAQVGQTTSTLRDIQRVTDCNIREGTPGSITSHAGTSHPRLSAKLPDPPLLTDGKTPVIEDWLTEMKAKLRVNHDHYPTDEIKLDYAKTRLGGDAKKHMASFTRDGAKKPFIHVDDMYESLVKIFGGLIDEKPSQDQLPTNGDLITQNGLFTGQEIGSSEDRLQHPVSLPLMRQTIRRVESRIDIRRHFSAPGNTLAHSDGQLASSGILTLSNPVDTGVSHSGGSQTGTGSLGSFEGTSQLIYTPPQNEQITPSTELWSQSLNTTKSQDEGDKSQDASSKSANNEGWELAIENLKQSHKNEMQDLKDNHKDEVKAMKVENKTQIEATEAEKLVLQQRIEALEACKATLEAESVSKQATVQHLVAVSQNLQRSNDKLKEQCDCMTKEAESNRSALSHQVATTPTVVEERAMAQQQLDSALDVSRALATDLATAQTEAVFYERRMAELFSAMEGTPYEAANLRGVIELKDKMFSDLEKRAGEAFTALATLEKESGEEKIVARRETAVLRTELGRKDSIIEDLRNSKDSFQSQCEAVFEMLLNKVYRNDLITAMEGYLEIVTQDNLTLKTGIERQASELSFQDLKLASLETALREAERSLTAEKESNKEFSLALNAKDIELGASEIRLDNLRAAQQSVIDERDEQLAEAHGRMQAAHDEALELMGKGRDERQRRFIESKDNRIAALERTYQELSSSHQLLGKYVEAQALVSDQNASAACVTKAESERALANLRAAQEQIGIQEEQLRGQLGLPASFDVAEVLAMKKTLDGAQMKIEELEHQLRSFQEGAAEDRGFRGVTHNDLYGGSDDGLDGEDGEANDHEESTTDDDDVTNFF